MVARNRPYPLVESIFKLYLHLRGKCERAPGTIVVEVGGRPTGGKN